MSLTPKIPYKYQKTSIVQNIRFLDWQDHLLNVSVSLPEVNTFSKKECKKEYQIRVGLSLQKTYALKYFQTFNTLQKEMNGKLFSSWFPKHNMETHLQKMM